MGLASDGGVGVVREGLCDEEAVVVVGGARVVVRSDCSARQVLTTGEVEV